MSCNIIFYHILCPNMFFLNNSEEWAKWLLWPCCVDISSGILFGCFSSIDAKSGGSSSLLCLAANCPESGSPWGLNHGELNLAMKNTSFLRLKMFGLCFQTMTNFIILPSLACCQVSVWKMTPLSFWPRLIDRRWNWTTPLLSVGTKRSPCLWCPASSETLQYLKFHWKSWERKLKPMTWTVNEKQSRSGLKCRATCKTIECAATNSNPPKYCQNGSPILHHGWQGRGIQRWDAKKPLKHPKSTKRKERLKDSRRYWCTLPLM